MNNEDENEVQSIASIASSSSPNPNQSGSDPDLSDEASLRSRGWEKTNNKHGFHFLRVLEAIVRPWLTALPESGQPIADLGACYGVHTIYALKHGRDVIAVDSDPLHMLKLRERASEVETSGRLQGTIVATLPSSELFAEGCFAGVLVAEMIHFLPPGGPQKLFNDIYKWLMPGGTLVTTSVSPSFMYNGGGKDLTYNGNITYERAMELLMNVPDDIVQLAPGFVELSPKLKSLGIFPDKLYIMTCEEVRTFAELAGFAIEACKYYSAGKYLYGNVADNDIVWLVARKPRI
ncbi:Methyltransferase [Gracilaria domingensis]|nr:Methyltransferase [Gracilaria domingensis]